jgi:DNA-binding NarL/FixJ family response regulator
VSSGSIRVAIADSNQLMLIGLKQVLSGETDFEIIGEARNITSLQSVLANNESDILLMDFTSKDFSLELIPEIIRDYPDLQVVAITPDQNSETIVNALKAGVASYVKKDCSLDEIISSVRDTAKGDRFFCSQILQSINAEEIDPDSEDFESVNCDPIKLSEREQEIITLIAEGHTNTAIAEKLFLSPHTVNTHRKNIMHKLGVKNTASIVMYAVKANLVNVNKFLFSK